MGHEEDRERKFEQALARHLREEAGAGAGANEVAGACPDAEVLAAFHERMLSSEEMNAVKEHVAACSRCQEILAHLEASDAIEVQAEEEKVFEMRVPALAGAAGRKEQFPWAAAAPTSVVSGTAASKAPRSISSGRSGKLLRWVAPAGAIAAGLLIWAVVRDSKLQTVAPAANVQVAQQRVGDEQAALQARDAANNLRSDAAEQSSRARNRQPSKTEKLDAPNSPAERQSQVTDRLSKDAGSGGGITGGLIAGKLATEGQSTTNKNLRATQSPARPKIMLRPGAAAGTPMAPVAGAGTRAPEAKQATNLPMTARNEAVLSPADGARKAPARERDTLSKEKMEPGVATDSPAAGPPPQPMSETVTVQSADEASEKPAQKKDEDSKNAEVAATAQSEVSASYSRTSTALKGKAAVDARIILTPGGTALWRLQGAGIIERSVDRGLTWSLQESGTTRSLIGGSAPSDVVCWIVGRRGLILRTTDGGGHWEKLAAPVAGDLAGIRATDALHATVLDRAGRPKFVTSDGGVNWERVKE